MDRFLLIFAIVLCFHVVISTSTGRVEYLPGFQGPLPFYLETGYVGVDTNEDVQLFYYFIQSESDPKNDPIMIWLTGGPGCSSISGLLFEIGPLQFVEMHYNGSLPNLILRPNSWTKIANIIFLDIPVGTGFSYATTTSAAHSDNIQYADHTYEFIKKWLNNHPEFISNPFYVGGGSYSGIPVPMVTQLIINGNEAATEPYINIKGYVLGNAKTFPNESNYEIQFANGMGLISDELYKADDDSSGSLIVRDKLSLIKDIRSKLSPARIELFSQTCFGPWLQLSDYCADPVLLYTFFERQEIPPGSTREEMYFRIGTHMVHFTRDDFCLITGLRFGRAPNDPTVYDGFARRTFGDRTPKLEQVMQIFNTIGGSNDNMEDVDAVKVCLMMMVHIFFLGHRKNVKVSPLVMKAIDNMDFWNSYPWGSFIWDVTIRQMYRCLGSGQRSANTKVTIYGFVFALKIWILEMFPGCSLYFNKNNNVYPRAIRWSRDRKRKVIRGPDVREMINVFPGGRQPLPRLIPEPVEMTSDWYVHSLSYFRGGGGGPPQCRRCG